VIFFAIPGDLDAPTGGYAYARRVIAGLRAQGRAVAVAPLGDGFPHADEPMRHAALAHIAALTAEAEAVVVDGLALGVLPELADISPGRYVALVHHPLALESGLTQAQAARLRISEARALSGAAHVISTSMATARQLAADYGVAAARLSVVRPGTDPAPFATGSGGVPALLSVGSLVPRKGHDVLIDALGGLHELDFHLTIVGDAGRDVTTATALAEQVARLGLAERVTLAGAVAAPTLERLYAGADLFVLASRHEGYGMAYAEAIAHGLPVVGTNAGAIPEVVGDAGVLVPPDDPAALAAALRPLITNADARAGLAARSRAAAARLPRWEEAARALADILDSMPILAL
jgi:glycosyltransferase involved in cell wall biosynthesis